MVVHQIYAHVFEDVVQNIIVCDSYEMANYLARCTYGETAFAVDCLQYPCQIGDKYKDRTFYHVDLETGKETAVAYVPTQEQQVAALNAALTDSQLELTEQYETNIKLQEKISNIQLALIEIYEGKEV